MVGERVAADAAIARVVLNLRVCFDDALAAVTLKRAPGPEAALQDLRNAIADAEAVGDIGQIAAGARWWACSLSLLKEWLNTSDVNVRRDTARAIDAVLRTVNLWQDGLIGAPPLKDGPGVN